MATVILLHAFPVNSALWVPVAQRLRGYGHDAVTPDLRGFGGHRHPGSTYDDIATSPDVDVMADDVLALLDGLGIDEAVIGGCSMGGYVAMALMRRRPDRLAGVILADTKAVADAPAAAENRENVARSVLEAGSTEALARAMLPGLLGDTSREQRPDVVDAVTGWIHDTDPRAVAWAQRAMARRPDSLGALAAFGGPALVVWGEQDTISPRPDQEAMLAVLQRGSFAAIADAGHLSPIEAPDVVAAAIAAWLP